jgi:hypothetical protein
MLVSCSILLFCYVLLLVQATFLAAAARRESAEFAQLADEKNKLLQALAQLKAPFEASDNSNKRSVVDASAQAESVESILASQSGSEPNIPEPKKMSACLRCVVLVVFFVGFPLYLVVLGLFACFDFLLSDLGVLKRGRCLSCIRLNGGEDGGAMELGEDDLGLIGMIAHV